ncbi:MAG: hypothetical protein M3222_03125, partial [Thermoproteota archaeon]|nr:hypothetical protein [Thermoproteota archaeon]
LVDMCLNRLNFKRIKYLLYDKIYKVAVCFQPENEINQKSHSKNEKLERGYEKQVVITIQGDTLIPTSKIDVFWHKRQN